MPGVQSMPDRRSGLETLWASEDSARQRAPVPAASSEAQERAGVLLSAFYASSDSRSGRQALRH